MAMTHLASAFDLPPGCQASRHGSHRLVEEHLDEVRWCRDHRAHPRKRTPHPTSWPFLQHSTPGLVGHGHGDPAGRVTGPSDAITSDHVRTGQPPAPQVRRHVPRLARPAPSRPLPDSTADYLRQSPLHTDDPRIDLALDHALASIATVGYQRTRLQDVAKAAGVSEAFLLIRFKTKLGMLRAIIDPGYGAAYEAFSAFQQAVADEYGPGIAEAVAWREYLNPNIRDRQILGLETDRLAKHDDVMREITLAAEQQVVDARLAEVSASERAARTGDTHMDFATGHGLPIVGLLLPHAWSLPLNMVTEPYLVGNPFA